MTSPKHVLIDPLSATSLIVEQRVNGLSLGTATGFCVTANEKAFLVTNWHVVSGRNPDTSQPLSPTAGIPDELLIAHHAAGKLGTWVVKPEALLDSQGQRRWLEHPTGKAVDVVALPLDNLGPDVTTYPLELALAEVDALVLVAMPVSIVGFPFGLTAGGAFPIWKTGHIASDPDLDYDGKPCFLIDATTRGGMSGAPVILRLYGGYATRSAAHVLGGGPMTKFLGIYSGRLHDQAEIGRVWRPDVIADILAAVP
ncbi:MAG: trypsin-like peptidase domain-containing protein [Planctomycetota bacterium]|nr:trypsin-like peptidase domain-containing protein [Planctomycetota bacterium]